MIFVMVLVMVVMQQDIYPSAPRFQHKIGQVQSIKLESGHKMRKYFPIISIWVTLIVSLTMNLL
jgi:hypothetical protein